MRRIIVKRITQFNVAQVAEQLTRLGYNVSCYTVNPDEELQFYSNAFEKDSVFLAKFDQKLEEIILDQGGFCINEPHRLNQLTTGNCILNSLDYVIRAGEYHENLLTVILKLIPTLPSKYREKFKSGLLSVGIVNRQLPYLNTHSTLSIGSDDTKYLGGIQISAIEFIQMAKKWINEYYN